MRLFVWLLIGIIIYFSYGRYHSVMFCQVNGKKAE
ncbi:MAG TPA: hypothetical protein PLG50_10455 [bacterium]|nr:hypothetical protein [bacterium]